MIPPLHHELALLRQSELRQEAASRRLVRQAKRDADRASRRQPRHDFVFLRTLGRRVVRGLATPLDLRTAMNATDR